MYSESFIPEHQRNPLIEALPPIIDDTELVRKLSSRQSVSDQERNLPGHLRKKFLARIGNFIEPSVLYVEVFRAIEDAILAGYTPKNPFSPTTQSFLHDLHYDRAVQAPSTGRFRPKGSSITIVGPSGAGKTYMVERILEFFPQRIVHDEYRGKELNLEQIVWLKINCPENLSLSGLISSILLQLDILTGSDESTKSLRKAEAIAKASVSIEQKFKWHFVGLLVIDEIQNLNLNNEKLRAVFLQFILVLINRTGVPVVFLGNPEVFEIFSASLKNARRAESGGVFKVDDPSLEKWTMFAEHLWKYQWTNPTTPFSFELSEQLRRLTTGLPDFAVRTFREAQNLVIGTSNEVISEAVLNEAFHRACFLSSSALSERRNGADGEPRTT